MNIDSQRLAEIAHKVPTTKRTVKSLQDDCLMSHARNR